MEKVQHFKIVEESVSPRSLGRDALEERKKKKQEAVLCPGSCKYLELTTLEMAGRQTRIGSRRGFDNFSVESHRKIIKGSSGCLALMPNHLRLSLGAPACFPSKPADRQTDGWAGLTTIPAGLASLLLPASLTPSPGNPGSDNDRARDSERVTEHVAPPL